MQIFRKKFYAAEKIRLENLRTKSQSGEEKKGVEVGKVVEKEKRPKLVRPSLEPLRRPTLEVKKPEATSLTSNLTSSSSRQGSITSRLLGLLPPSTEPRRRPGSILNPGIGAISEVDDTVLSNGTLNSRLASLALGGRGTGEVIRKVKN